MAVLARSGSNDNGMIRRVTKRGNAPTIHSRVVPAERCRNDLFSRSSIIPWQNETARMRTGWKKWECFLRGNLVLRTQIIFFPTMDLYVRYGCHCYTGPLTFKTYVKGQGLCCNFVWQALWEQVGGRRGWNQWNMNPMEYKFAIDPPAAAALYHHCPFKIRSLVWHNKRWLKSDLVGIKLNQTELAWKKLDCSALQTAFWPHFPIKMFQRFGKWCSFPLQKRPSDGKWGISWPEDRQ